MGENGRIGALLGFESIGSDSVGRTLSANDRDNVLTPGGARTSILAQWNIALPW